MRVRKTFVGPRLRQLRKERAQSQVDMAKALGVSASYVNLLENNQRSLSLPVLLRVAEVYGVEPIRVKRMARAIEALEQSGILAGGEVSAHDLLPVMAKADEILKTILKKVK